MKTTLQASSHLNKIQFKPLFNINRLAVLIFFLLIISQSQATTLLRLKMTGPNNSSDETVIYYQTGATDGFDSQYDSYKIFGPNPAPHIAQQYGTTLLQINGISPVVTTFSIHLKATTNATGSFTLKVSEMQELPAGTSVYLIDRYTHDSINLLKNDCHFTLSDTTKAARFIVHIKGVGSAVPTAIKQQVKQTARLGSLGNNAFVLTSDQDLPTGLTAELVSLNGTIVKRTAYDTMTQPVTLDFKEFEPGIYVLRLTGDSQSTACFKILLN